MCRTLHQLVAPAACQGQSEDASEGHLVLRLRASFLVCSPSRVLCTGPLTMEESLFRRKPDWRFVDLEPLA